MSQKRKPKKVAVDRESKRSLAALKTAVPLVLTVLLLGLVYLFVLMPVKPENILKKSIQNTFNRDKQKSMRFDGTFGTEEPNLKGEYSAQYASNDDMSILVSVDYKDQKVTYQQREISGMSYVKFTGTPVIPKILADIPGAKPLDTSTTEVLAAAEDTWIESDASLTQTAANNLSCIKEIGAFTDSLQNINFEGDSFPLEITEGPFSTGDGSTDQLFKVKIKDVRTKTAQETAFVETLNCLESLRGDDYRLRQVTNDDVKVLAFEISTDSLNNTIRSIKYKQFGNYFQIFFRDFNKDVSVIKPESAVKVMDLVARLSPESQAALLQKTGL